MVADEYGETGAMLLQEHLRLCHPGVVRKVDVRLVR
jgi:hypothetical protein